MPAQVISYIDLPGPDLNDRDLALGIASQGARVTAAEGSLQVYGGPYAKFRHAIANRMSSPVDIMCIGDSLTEGARASTLETRWVNVLRDLLRAAYPTPGITGGFGYIPAQYYTTGPNNNSQVFTLGGTANVLADTTFGLGKRSVVLDASGEKINASGVVCSSFDVVYTQGTTQGVVGVSIDGGAVVTHATNGATSSGTRWNAGALTPGPHDIEISWQSGNKVDLEGIMVYNGDESAGIRMWEGGHGGFKAGFFDISAAPTYWQECVTNVQPDLVLIELGANDWWYNSGVVSGSYGNFAPAQMKTYLTNIINGIRARCTIPPSIALLIAHDRGDASQVVGQVPLLPWNDYVAAYYELAAADPSIGIIDMRNIMGPVPYTVGAPSYGQLHVDKVHLVDSGNTTYANAIFHAITAGA